MIFVSYSWKDQHQVVSIVDQIRSSGRRVWIDYERLDLEKPLKRQIWKAIDECDEFVHIVTPNSIASDWVAFEIASALQLKNARQISHIYL